MRIAEGGRRKAEFGMRDAEGGRRNAGCGMRKAEGGEGVIGQVRRIPYNHVAAVDY